MKRYRYSANPFTAVFAVLVFVPTTYWIFTSWTFGDRISFLADWSAGQSAAIWYFIGVCSLVCTGGAVFTLYKSFSSEKSLVLTHDTLEIPSQWFNGTVSKTNIADIVSVKHRKFDKLEGLEIITKDGKLSINKGMMRRRDFNELAQYLMKIGNA